MTQQPQPTQPAMIDLNKVLPTIANLYRQMSWAIPIVEKLTGFKIPKEIIASLDALAEGKPMTAEQMEKLKTSIESMPESMPAPAIGEPVLTQQLAETAWWLHYKEGMGTREIAEQFTKDGSPCSHATVARWINMIDEQRRFGRMARLIQIGKILGFIGLIVLVLWIGKTFL